MFWTQISATLSITCTWLLVASYLRREHVLEAHVDALLDDAAIHWLVNSHTHRPLGHVEHYTGAPVVVLERHTLVLGRVDLHVYVVTALTNQGGK